MITSEGHALGTFCVLDERPHDWTEEEIGILRVLAMSAMSEIELRRLVAKLRASTANLQGLVESGTSFSPPEKAVAGRAAPRPPFRDAVRDFVAAPAAGSPKPQARSLEDVERQHIVAVLEETGWRVSGERGAARILGLKRTTLEARMKKLEILRRT